MVEGDPLPHLVRCFPEAFAEPVTKIFKEINNTGRWPAAWKTEYLTIIPKTPNPTDLLECRNISCTSVFSKILEGQVLKTLREEPTPDPNQYGGKPKCGVEHMLVDLWEKILTTLEGGGDAALLLGINYEKAFNRMEHSVCLKQLCELGASPSSISLVRAFLEDRCMTISIKGKKASPIPIHRGSPEGSVFGSRLYCATTQSLTAKARNPGLNQPDRVIFPQDSSDDEGMEMWAAAVVQRTGPDAFLYVDDTKLFDAVPLSTEVGHYTTGTTTQTLQFNGLGAAFAGLESGAKKIGMKINKKKTQLLVISPPMAAIQRQTWM